VIGPGADDHLALGAHRLRLVVAQHLDARGALAVEDEARGKGIGEHLDVAALLRRMQVRHRRAAPPAVSLRELNPARPPCVAPL
jgi:GNAT superfamily N-acetyltransferase